VDHIKKSTNWANQYDIYFGGAPTGGGPGYGPPEPPKSGPFKKYAGNKFMFYFWYKMM